jgi:NAD(P)H dehydrogenase (quinone)
VLRKPDDPPGAAGARRARVLVVCCHPNPESFTHAVFARVVAGLDAAGCDTDPLDLYAEGFDPVLVVNATRRRRDLDKVPETAPHRARVAQADAVAFVYPVWWGGFPAMLKGFIDRVFVSGLTYTFEGRPPGAVLPQGLMRGRPAHFFYTLDAPALVAWLDPGWLSNTLSVFRYCGFGPVRRHYLASLKRKSAAQRARWLDEAQRRAESMGRALAR